MTYKRVDNENSTMSIWGIVVRPLRITLHYSSMTISETTSGLYLK